MILGLRRGIQVAETPNMSSASNQRARGNLGRAGGALRAGRRAHSHTREYVRQTVENIQEHRARVPEDRLLRSTFPMPPFSVPVARNHRE